MRSFVFLANIALSDAPFTAQDFLDKLFPNFWSFLIQFLALIVLFVAVYFIAYKPLSKLVKARKDYVEHNLRDSEQAKKIAEAKAAEVASTIASSKIEANQIVEVAKAKAKVEAAAIAEDAATKAMAKQAEADVAIKQAEEKSRQAIHDEIVNVALDASKQVLGREVSAEDNSKLVSGFVDEVSAESKEKGHE
jgi:F-type H+-transporting ATPase subunit b